MTDKLAEAGAEPGMFEAMRKSIARKARNQKAPYDCIDCVEAAATMPFDEGIKIERQLFAELENADEAKALRYAFFAEREVAKIPGLPKDMVLPEIKTIAVVGAGTMGGGIAMSCVDNGFPVKLLDASPEVLTKGLERIRNNYAVSVKRGSLTQEEMDKRMALIEPVETYEAIADCDAVIEAVFERMPVKKEVFAKLDAVMKPGALLYTNTSALDIDEIANATKRPEVVAGTHFFVPANVMKTFEVVEGAKTSPATLAAAMKLGRDIGKVSAYAGNCDGFVANRSRIPFNLEQGLMIEEGALPEQVDKVMVDFGYPVGPFAVNDMSGLDISYDTRKRRAAENPNYRGLPITDRLVEMGRLGQKTGKGWYRYEKGDRTPIVDPEVHAHHQGGRDGKGLRAAHLHGRGGSAPPAVLLRQRGLQDPGGGQGAARQRHRRDVAQRLRLPALSRRPDVLGRRHRRARGLQPDRRLAPALRRALAAVGAAARARRARRTAARAEGADEEVGMSFPLPILLQNGEREIGSRESNA